ncbi:TatD family hydrolase [Rhodococcus triatomae]
MTKLPPLDLHAHIDPGIAARELRELEAVVFAATRSLDEAETALSRDDPLVVWGVGVHPGIASAQQHFDPDHFRELSIQTAFASEIGLDGTSRVPVEMQLRTLRSVLTVLADQPRITSLHSYNATDVILDEIAKRQLPGVILHWWLGSARATERAVELGCHFSVNAAMFRRRSALTSIPVDRLLPETDHPHGDRTGPGPHKPGNVLPVEFALGKIHGISPDQTRRVLWRNLGRLADEADCTALLPDRIRALISFSRK